MIDVEVVEVGPRDGLQNIATFLSSDAKKRWIAAEAAAGVREIEVCSFVPPKVVPQFVDAVEITSFARTFDDLLVAVLVPNAKGAERAIAAGAQKVSFPLSVSESHSRANVRKTSSEQVEELARIVAIRDAAAPESRPLVSVGLSTAFGCTIEGTISEDAVVRLAVAAVEAGADDLSLSDTVGYANPAQVRRLFRLVRAEVGEKLASAHFHDTRGLALANVVAALDAGIRSFDSSLGGLGGCPFAPGASGNVATEDLVFMLESMGMRTGIDFDALLAARDIVRAALPNETLFGRIASAGVPKGFERATTSAA